MKEKMYAIIPGCSDLNRGDQALVWETRRLAEDAGFIGQYYFLCDSKASINQTLSIGIKNFEPILLHPSSKFNDKDNINYDYRLIIKWGAVAFLDFLTRALLLNKVTRIIGKLFLNKEQKELLNIFKNTDAFFVKGGGFIHAFGGITSWYYIFYQLFHINLALSFRKDVYIMPNSYGPFKGLIIKKMINNTLKKCKFISSRESISQKILKNEIGIKSKLYPDLAFYLNCGNIDLEGVMEKYKLKVEKPLVAITLRPYRFPQSRSCENKYLNYKTEFIKFIKILYKKGFMPVLVEHTLAENFHENDMSCIKDVEKELVKDEYRIISNKDYTCKELKSIYGVFDYIIGTRFHSVIFSLAQKIPAIAITYGGNKGQGIMNDIGLGKLTIPIEEVSCNALEEKFEYIINNEKEIKLKLDNYLKLLDFERDNLIKDIKAK